MLLAAGAGGYAAAVLVLGAPSDPADVDRMAECIRKLAEYNNDQTSERLQQRGVVEYFYNRERDLCLHRTNYVSASENGDRFEKQLVDVFSNTMLAQYAEEAGQPLTEDVTVFNAEYDRLFQTAPAPQTKMSKP
jgi:hypothetical protein